VNNSSLDFLFNPRSIAIVGASNNDQGINMGRDFVKAFIDAGFRGSLYPINPAGGEVLGLKIYTNIREIPGPVDFVISAIPARFVLQLLDDCIAKRVKAIHLFTAGFAETEGETGKQLQSQILAIAQAHGIRLIGPNCMGLYCPKTGISFARDLPNQDGFSRIAGQFSFISQSGGNSIYCIRNANTAGINFSKVVSYGNAIDIDEVDLLEYLSNDNDTTIIGAYIEGVKDGRRLMKTLKNITRTKPVIILKVGETEEGTRAAASHTGALAGSKVLWPYLFKQTGVIQADSIDEIVDIAKLFLNIKVPKGRNTVIFGTGGGATVKAADDCTIYGLKLPAISKELRMELTRIYGAEAGNIFKNPLDLMPILSVDKLVQTLKMIADEDITDLLILQVAFDTWSLIEKSYAIKLYIDATIKLKSMIDKPVISVFHYVAADESDSLARSHRAILTEAGIPIFSSIQRAAQALDKFIQYNERFVPCH
jgi:acyl-CoA synthetase (NDP forming)